MPTSGDSILAILGPGSQFYADTFAGDFGDYAASISDAVDSGDERLLCRQARDPADVYDGLSRLHLRLTTASYKEARGQYMSSYAIAHYLSSAIPLGDSVCDPTAGIGTLLAALPATFLGQRWGRELSPLLVTLARVAQKLSFCPDAPLWCEQGDLFADYADDSASADALVMSPPWVLRQNISPSLASQLVASDAFGELIASSELFDLCVPSVVIATRRFLREGGSFVATVPRRVAMASDWNAFRQGEIHKSVGLVADLEFLNPPPWAASVYPTEYMILRGRLLRRDAFQC